MPKVPNQDKPEPNPKYEYRNSLLFKASAANKSEYQMSKCPKRYKVSNPAIGEFGVPTCLSFNSTILLF